MITNRYYCSTKINGSHHGDSTLLKPLGVQIATKSLPAPTTREHRKLIGVISYSFYCLKCCVPVFQNLSYKLQIRLSDELSICQSFPSSRRVTQRRVMRHSTRNATNHCSVKRFIKYLYSSILFIVFNYISITDIDWSVPLPVKCRMTCLRVTPRELEFFLYHRFF